MIIMTKGDGYAALKRELKIGRDEDTVDLSGMMSEACSTPEYVFIT